MPVIRSIIKSTGSYLPEKILTNQELEKMVDTSDEWITQRSGIKQRHIAAEKETTADLAIKAGHLALDRSGLSPQDIQGVIVATTTPDQTFPAVAVKVQAALGIPPGMAFDVQAVCTGFVYALATANNFITSGQFKRILVIGAEKMSSVVDWNDRSTCVLFADGAGAVILEAQESEDESIHARGVHSTHLLRKRSPRKPFIHRWRPVQHRTKRPYHHGRPRGLQTRRSMHGRCRSRSHREKQHHPRRR